MRNYIARKLRRMATWTETAVLVDAGRVRLADVGKELSGATAETWYIGAGTVTLFIETPKWWTRIRPLPKKPEPISLDEIFLKGPQGVTK